MGGSSCGGDGQRSLDPRRKPHSPLHFRDDIIGFQRLRGIRRIRLFWADLPRSLIKYVIMRQTSANVPMNVRHTSHRRKRRWAQGVLGPRWRRSRGSARRRLGFQHGSLPWVVVYVEVSVRVAAQPRRRNHGSTHQRSCSRHAGVS